MVPDGAPMPVITAAPAIPSAVDELTSLHVEWEARAADGGPVFGRLVNAPPGALPFITTPLENGSFGVGFDWEPGELQDGAWDFAFVITDQQGNSLSVPINLDGDTIHLGNLGLGDDPSQEAFGANRFDVSSDGTDTPWHLQDGAAILDRHTSYLDENTASLDNITNVVIDRDDQVDLVPGRDTPAHDRLYDFARDEAAYQAQQALENYVVEPLGEVRDTVVDGAGRVVDGAGQVVDGVRDGAEDLGRRFSDAWPDHWP